MNTRLSRRAAVGLIVMMAALSPLQVEGGLLDRRVVATFQVICEAEREPIHRNELRVDTQGEFEVLDRRVRLTQPHPDIAAPS